LPQIKFAPNANFEGFDFTFEAFNSKTMAVCDETMAACHESLPERNVHEKDT